MSDVVRFRGDDEPLTMRAKLKRRPVDLTGYTDFILSISAEENPVSAAYLFQSTGVFVGDPADGVVDFPISEDNADNLGQYWFDIQATRPDGKKKTFVKALIEFVQDIGK